MNTSDNLPVSVGSRFDESSLQPRRTMAMPPCWRPHLRSGACLTSPCRAPGRTAANYDAHVHLAAHARLPLAPRRTPGRTSPPPRVPIFCRSLTPFPSVLVCPLKIRGAGRRDGLPHHAEGARTTTFRVTPTPTRSRSKDDTLMPPGRPPPTTCAAGGC